MIFIVEDFVSTRVFRCLNLASCWLKSGGAGKEAQVFRFRNSSRHESHDKSKIRGISDTP